MIIRVKWEVCFKTTFLIMNWNPYFIGFKEVGLTMVCNVRYVSLVVSFFAIT